MYFLAFYVPESHKESVKQALFEAGAGKFNSYDMCSFETRGAGQFRPLEGSTPFIGESHNLEQVTEYKVEMVLKDEVRERAISALKRAHPYEEVAYHLIKIEI